MKKYLGERTTPIGPRCPVCGWAMIWSRTAHEANAQWGCIIIHEQATEPVFKELEDERREDRAMAEPQS